MAQKVTTQEFQSILSIFATLPDKVRGFQLDQLGKQEEQRVANEATAMAIVGAAAVQLPGQLTLRQADNWTQVFKGDVFVGEWLNAQNTTMGVLSGMNMSPVGAAILAHAYGPTREKAAMLLDDVGITLLPEYDSVTFTEEI
jgi:hypothetical protein